MLRTWLGLGLAVGFSANAYAGFSIVEKGDQVCREEVGKADECLPLFSKQFGTTTPNFDIVEYMRTRLKTSLVGVDKLSREELLSYAAASVLDTDELRYVLDNYEDISARHVGFQEIKTADGKKSAKFFTSIFFKRNGMINYTVQIVGELKMDPSLTFPLNQLLAHAKDVRQNVQINELSDDKTELKREYLRWVETVARYVNYQIVGVKGFGLGAVDQKTVQDVTQIVAPVVFARVVAESAAKNGEDILQLIQKVNVR